MAVIDIELITDRTSADAAQGTDKGYYRVSDYNRVYSYLQALADKVANQGYYFPHDLTFDFGTEEEPKLLSEETLQTYLQNTLSASKLYGNASLYNLPSSMDGLNYEKANAIESTLENLNELADNAKKAYIYCGTINCGQPFGVRPMMILPEPTYSVTYSANGGTGSITDGNSPYEEGMTVTIMSGFEREDYNFMGYNTQADGSGTSYEAGDTFSMPANDVTLYAQWQAIVYSYSVYYVGNGGSGTLVDANSPYPTGTTVTVLANTFELDDYDFTEWNTAQDGTGTSYGAGSSFVMGEADVYLYAQWTEAPQYEVLDGIYSTDGAYIDLDFYAKAGVTEIGIEFMSIQSSSVRRDIMGGGGTQNINSTIIRTNNNNQILLDCNGNTSLENIGSLETNKIYEVVIKEDGTYINDVLYDRTVGDGERLEMTHSIFVAKGSSGAILNNYATNIVVLSSYIKEEGVTFYNLIPVRRLTDNLITMYDTISGEYQEVLGGTFIEYDPYAEKIEVSVDSMVTLSESGTNTIGLYSNTSLVSGLYVSGYKIVMEISEGFKFNGSVQNDGYSTRDGFSGISDGENEREIVGTIGPNGETYGLSSVSVLKISATTASIGDVATVKSTLYSSYEVGSSSNVVLAIDSTEVATVV